MARIQFPSNPTLNQVFTLNNRSWLWDGIRWKSTTIGTTQVFQQDVVFNNNITLQPEIVPNQPVPILKVERGEDEAQVGIYWDEDIKQWKIDDDDDNYNLKKIILEYDTLDGGEGF
jgi:ethanolamine utilization protein EutA (predicted chaperonin)